MEKLTFNLDELKAERDKLERERKRLLDELDASEKRLQRLKLSIEVENSKLQAHKRALHCAMR